MPNDQTSEKETRLATALKALDQKEVGAYRYFLTAKQAPISEETSDEMLQLYLQGASCDDIRRQRPGFGLGQIVAARVMYDWDIRRAEYRRGLETKVPARAVQVHLEQVDFLADILTASQLSTRKKIREYIATGNETLLEGLPIPKSIRDYKELLALFISATGQDKKRVEVTGKVTVDHGTGAGNTVTSAEAAKIMDALLGEDVIDVTPIENVPAAAPQRALLPVGFKQPRTPEEMVDFLVGQGVRREKAEALIESVGKDTQDLAKRYSDLVMAMLEKKPVN